MRTRRRSAQQHLEATGPMSAWAPQRNRLRLAEAAAIPAASPVGWINTDFVSAEREVIERESFLLENFFAYEAVALA
jgi:hypothetical protein